MITPQINLITSWLNNTYNIIQYKRYKVLFKIRFISNFLSCNFTAVHPGTFVTCTSQRLLLRPHASCHCLLCCPITQKCQTRSDSVGSTYLLPGCLGVTKRRKCLAFLWSLSQNHNLCLESCSQRAGLWLGHVKAFTNTHRGRLMLHVHLRYN